jgi:hypothetical protein
VLRVTKNHIDRLGNRKICSTWKHRWLKDRGTEKKKRRRKPYHGPKISFSKNQIEKSIDNPRA